MLHQHELEKYIFSSQIADNRKVFKIYHTKVEISQDAFIYSEATVKAFSKTNKTQKQTNK